jgi:hypothetical protein
VLYEFTILVVNSECHRVPLLGGQILTLVFNRCLAFSLDPNRVSASLSLVQCYMSLIESVVDTKHALISIYTERLLQTLSLGLELLNRAFYVVGDLC